MENSFAGTAFAKKQRAGAADPVGKRTGLSARRYIFEICRELLVGKRIQAVAFASWLSGCTNDAVITVGDHEALAFASWPCGYVNAARNQLLWSSSLAV